MIRLYWNYLKLLGTRRDSPLSLVVMKPIGLTLVAHFFIRFFFTQWVLVSIRNLEHNSRFDWIEEGFYRSCNLEAVLFIDRWHYSLRQVWTLFIAAVHALCLHILEFSSTSLHCLCLSLRYAKIAVMIVDCTQHVVNLPPVHMKHNFLPVINQTQYYILVVIAIFQLPLWQHDAHRISSGANLPSASNVQPIMWCCLP